MTENATPAAPAADAQAPDTSLLDAPTKPAGEPEKTSLLDKKADENPDGKTSPDASKPAADDTGKTPDVPVVPEKYADPKLPEGMTLDPTTKAEFDAVAKDLKLTQEQYQKVFDIQAKHNEAQIKQTMDVFQKQIREWKAETEKELGPNPEKSLVAVHRAIDRIFTDPEENKAFRSMMTETGLGNWRLMVKAFSFVGKAISEDKLVEGKPGVEKPKSFEDVVFDHPSSVAARKGAS